jgi:integrase
MSSKHGKGYRARWTDEKGERQSRCFRFKRDADLFEMRKKAEVEEIGAGIRAEKPCKRSFSEACDLWLVARSKKRSAKDDRSIINKHLRPFIGNKACDEIDESDGDTYANEHDDLSEKTVGNHITLFTSILNYVSRLKPPWLASVPKFKRPSVSWCSQDYQYLRSDEEMSRFLRAAKEEDPIVFAMYATAIYTGMRAGELAGLQWTDIDFDQRLITVQRSYGGPTKSKRIRRVPVLSAILPILRSWRLKCGTRLVFPSHSLTMQQASGRIFQEVLHRVLERAGFKKVERNGKLRSYIRFHDLRHTFASHWMMKGGTIYKLQRILGHQSIAMTERYSHLAPAAFKEDYDLFEAPVIELGEVIELPVKKESDAAPSTATNDTILAVTG